MLWISLVLFYGLLKGGREILKKLAMNRNTVMEVLVTYTVLSFIFVLPQLPQAGGMELKFYFYIALKSFAIFLAWMFGFRSIKYLPVSLFGILDLSRVLFSTFSGVVFLGERINFMRGAGLAVVCLGLILLKFSPGRQTLQNNTPNNTSADAKIKTFYIILALFSCLLNACSGLMDKVLMKSVTSSQLQFWYMLFLVIYYLIYV
ncbi:MAG: EamA family transporter, partial [Treponema sp.]|nr:EamA family transporter [Treponema sp.]